jgi:DNA-binding LacI/PurR family transcriptional regulator
MKDFYPDRHQGFRQAMAEADLDVCEKWVRIIRSRSDWEDSVQGERRQILSGNGSRPDAIFAGHSRAGLAVQQHLEDRGLRVPEDVAVIVLEDNIACRLEKISLSAVVPPIDEIGREAARVALELIRNPDSGPIRRVIQGCEVIQRNSTRV